MKSDRGRTHRVRAGSSKFPCHALYNALGVFRVRGLLVRPQKLFRRLSGFLGLSCECLSRFQNCAEIEGPCWWRRFCQIGDKREAKQGKIKSYCWMELRKGTDDAYKECPWPHRERAER
jgi:hypothetical protein